MPFASRCYYACRRNGSETTNKYAVKALPVLCLKQGRRCHWVTDYSTAGKRPNDERHMQSIKSGPWKFYNALMLNAVTTDLGGECYITIARSIHTPLVLPEARTARSQATTVFVRIFLILRANNPPSL